MKQLSRSQLRSIVGGTEGSTCAAVSCTKKEDCANCDTAKSCRILGALYWCQNPADEGMEP